MPRIVHVVRHDPKAEGHGARHRAYQINAELTSSFTETDLVHFPLSLSFSHSHEVFWGTHSAATYVAELRARLTALLAMARHLGSTYRYYDEHVRRAIVARNPFGKVATETYEQMLLKTPKPQVCVLDHPGFWDLIRLNNVHGIATIFCPQNLESLDRYLATWSIGRSFEFTLEFLAELDAVSACSERLMISKVEAGLLMGLGMSAQYYPYLPLGDIRDQLTLVRRGRDNTMQERGLFLLLGSGDHSTTAQSMKWFIQQAKHLGLPRGIRVVVCGKQTDKLIPPGDSVPGLECRGWLAQDDLNWLMLRASGILIPQRSGFGALTRVPEMACAGIPVVVSDQPCYAINPPPGICVASGSWDDWCEQMTELARGSLSGSAGNWREYEAWASAQPTPLSASIRQYLA